jgi:hypothetical protein
MHAVERANLAQGATIAIKAKTDDVLARTRALVTDAARAAGGSNTTISRSEEQALPDGLLKTTVAAVRAEAGNHTVKVDAVVDKATAAVEELVRRVDTRAIGTLSAAEIQKLAKTDHAVAVEVARAYELITGKAIALPATAPADLAPGSTDSPGAHGSDAGVELGARLQHAKQALKDDARRMDRNGDGKLTVSELRYATGRMGPVDSAGVPGVDYARDLDAIGRYARSRSSSSAPTLEQWDQTVDAAAGMVERADADRNGFIDGDEKNALVNKPAGSAMYDATAQQPDRFALPRSTLYDHDGERPVDRRDPLDKNLPPDQLARQIVWRNNLSDNDNRWPVWTGWATSRHRIGPDEAPGVIADLESLSKAKAKKVLKELAAWIAVTGPGRAYIMPDQVPLFDALATRLGVRGLNFVGAPKAPTLHI